MPPRPPLRPGTRTVARAARRARIRKDGSWIRPLIQGGRAAVRTALAMGTLTAIRRNPTIGALYRRLIQAGRPAKLAIIACLRQLLTMPKAILRDRIPWHTA